MVHLPKRQQRNDLLWLNSTIIIALLLASLTNAALGLATKAQKKKKPSGGGVGFGAKKVEVLSYTPDASPSTRNLQNFLQRAQSKGLDKVDIGVDESTGIRGLYAKKAIKKNQVICRIPSDCALALADPSSPEESSLVQNGLFFLQQYIVNEQAKNFWAPYLDTLPKSANEASSAVHHLTPNFWSQEEIQQLEFPKMIQNIHQRQEEIQSLAKSSNMDEDELKWATWLATTRSFPIQLSEGDDDEGEASADNTYDERGQVMESATKDSKYIRVLVPLIDMVNHDPNNFNVQFQILDPEKDEAWFVLEATRNIPAGKEIKLTYGSGVYSSMEFLLNYGFLFPQKNPVDASLLKKASDSDDDFISTLDGWKTSLQEDESKLQEQEESSIGKQIYQFRVNLKQSYE